MLSPLFTFCICCLWLVKANSKKAIEFNQIIGRPCLMNDTFQIFQDLMQIKTSY